MKKPTKKPSTRKLIHVTREYISLSSFFSHYFNPAGLAVFEAGFPNSDFSGEKIYTLGPAFGYKRMPKRLSAWLKKGRSLPDTKKARRSMPEISFWVDTSLSPMMREYIKK